MSHGHVNFSKYFALKQRAYLINISEERDREHYESLSGSIVECSGDRIALQVPYATDQEQLASPEEGAATTYKLTSEALGSGIQVMADLVKVAPGNIFHLRLRGNLEMYQRRQTPRVDTSIRMFRMRREKSLAVYRKEYKRIVEYISSQGVPPNLKLEEVPVNLSAGGLCLQIDPAETAPSLAMLFLDLNDGQLPICTVAELVWSRQEEGAQRGGHRFLQIRKSDQERISRHVLELLKNKGISAAAPKVNWELIDRMTFQEEK